MEIAPSLIRIINDDNDLLSTRNCSSPFKYRRSIYDSVDRAYHAAKAELFRQYELSKAILNAPTVDEAMGIGYNYSDAWDVKQHQIWGLVDTHILRAILFSKYNTPKMRQYLINITSGNDPNFLNINPLDPKNTVGRLTKDIAIYFHGYNSKMPTIYFVSDSMGMHTNLRHDVTKICIPGAEHAIGMRIVELICAPYVNQFIIMVGTCDIGVGGRYNRFGGIDVNKADGCQRGVNGYYLSKRMNTNFNEMMSYVHQHQRLTFIPVLPRYCDDVKFNKQIGKVNLNMYKWHEKFGDQVILADVFDQFCDPELYNYERLYNQEGGIHLNRSGLKQLQNCINKML